MLVFIGKGYLNKKEYVILNRQKFTLTVPSQKQVRWDGKAFECFYDPDYGGFEYAGYLMVLKNRSGEITFRKASRTSWASNAEAILSAQLNMGYNRDFTAVHMLQKTFGLPGDQGQCR